MIYLTKIRSELFQLQAGICLALCLFLWVSPACGPYSFSSSGATHIKTVAIPVFQDQTAEFGIKEKLTQEVINEFTRDNTLRITDRRNADSLIEGTVVQVVDRAGAFTSDEKVQDIQVFITVRVRYEDLVKRKVLWEEEITQWGTFNPDEGAQSRENGINEAVTKITNEILNKTVSGW
ncbi:MAG: LptE family protein [bacterium]